jgi:hypothetical protein
MLPFTCFSPAVSKDSKAAARNVLLKEPKGRDVGEDDVFTVNEAFKSKSIRVKLSAVSSQKEGDVEHIETRQKVRLQVAGGSRAT